MEPRPLPSPEPEPVEPEPRLELLPALDDAEAPEPEEQEDSHEEIAKGFGRTISFSKSQLARGHARLRKVLSPPTASGVGASLLE